MFVNGLKTLVRSRAPKLYDEIILLVYGRNARCVRGLGRRMEFRKFVRSQRPFKIDVCDRQGFGGTLTQIVKVHHFFLGQPGPARVVASNPLYSSADQSDFISMFFDRLTEAPCEECVTIPYRYPEDITLKTIGEGLTHAVARELFKSNYCVKQQFIEEAQAFFCSNFDKALGIHYRGSDKRLDAKLASFDAFATTVDHWVEKTGIDKLFIATDEPEFLRLMQLRYGANRATALECKYLSDGLRGSHYLSGDGFEKGREALLTMLILGMCQICIRGASNLSAWSKILNPQLPVITLGKPFDIYASSFPENELIGNSHNIPRE